MPLEALSIEESITAENKTPLKVTLTGGELVIRIGVDTLKNAVRLDMLRRIHELRKSCGVEPINGTVSVRIPFQYVKD